MQKKEHEVPERECIKAAHESSPELSNQSISAEIPVIDSSDSHERLEDGLQQEDCPTYADAQKEEAAEDELRPDNTEITKTRKHSQWRKTISAIFLAFVLILVCVPTIYPEASAYYIILYEHCRAKFDKDKTDLFWRLLKYADDMTWNKSCDYTEEGDAAWKNALVLSHEATNVARNFGDHETLLAYGLLETANYHRFRSIWYNHDFHGKLTQKDIDEQKLAELNLGKKLATEALSLVTKLHGERHYIVYKAYDTLAQLEGSLAMVKEKKLRSPRSLELWKKALWCAERSEGPYSHEAFETKVYLQLKKKAHYAHACFPSATADSKYPRPSSESEFKHEFALAEKLYREDISNCESLWGKFHPYTAQAINSYACFLRGRQRYSEAAEFENRADEIWEHERKNPTWKLVEFDYNY